MAVFIDPAESLRGSFTSLAWVTLLARAGLLTEG
jgi:hypothetical protein